MPSCNVSRKRKTQCPVEGRVSKPRQHTPQGCPETPETEVLVLHEMPLRMCFCTLTESGLVRSKSRKRKDATVAIKKQPSVITSSKDASFDNILVSQAAKTAKGIGDASDLSKGIYTGLGLEKVRYGLALKCDTKW